MKITVKMQDALNGQLNAELYSAYLYLSMSAYFDSINLKGFAHWMRKQAKEEEEHAMKFYTHISDRDGTITLKAIDKPPLKWKSPLDAFRAAYKHEQKVTGMIHNLVSMSNSQKDHATASFLQWFVDEQVEEEASAKEVVDRLKLAGSSKSGLMVLDGELAKRK